MAAGDFIILDRAIEKAGTGVIDFLNDSFRVVLCGPAQPLTPDFAGASGAALYADLTDEVVGAGYTVGGAEMDSSWTRAGGTSSFTAEPVGFTGLDATVKWVVIVRDGGDEDVVAYADADMDAPAGRVFPGIDTILTFPEGILDSLRQA